MKILEGEEKVKLGSDLILLFNIYQARDGHVSLDSYRNVRRTQEKTAGTKKNLVKNPENHAGNGGKKGLEKERG